MGLLDFLKGKNPDGTPRWSRWDWASTPETMLPFARAVLEKAASLLGAADVKWLSEQYAVELRGTVDGLPLRVKMGFNGSVQELKVSYPRVGVETFIDLEHDPDARPPRAESEGRAEVAPGIFCEGASAAEEAGRFRELPADLQARVIGEIRRLRIRYFRSRPEAHEVMLFDEAKGQADPPRWLADAIRIAVDVAKARGAVPPSMAPKKQRPKQEPKPEPEDPTGKAGWKASLSLAAKIAAQAPGAKVVERSKDEEIDVLLAEGEGAPLRIVLDASFENVQAAAAAEGLSGELDLEFDFEVEPDDAKEPADEEDEEDEAVQSLFFGRCVYLSGTAEEVGRQAALLRALPRALLDELIRALEEGRFCYLFLDRGELRADLGDLKDVADDGADALAVARLVGRVATALPRGALPAPPALTLCGKCKARFVGDEAKCPHCGAAR